MIDLTGKDNCICRKYENTQPECINNYTIMEKGKSVKLEPKNNNELVTVIIIDKCLITDNKTKCDALFLYKTNTKKYTFLVELKGAGDINKAYSQLSHTRNEREEYADIIDKFRDIDGKQVIQRYAIVSNRIQPKPELERLEKEYKIRIKKILVCDATSPIPDLKVLI